MASNASEGLAALERRPAAHRLNDVPVAVEELEIDGRHSWDLEICGAVLFNGNFSENVFDVPRRVVVRGRRANERAARGAPISGLSNSGGAEFKSDDAQRFDDPALDPLKSRPFVNVLNIESSSGLIEVDLGRSSRRRLAFLQRDRLTAADRRVKREQLALSVEIEPIESKWRFIGPSAALGKIGAQEGRFIERIRILEELALLTVRVDPIGGRLANRRNESASLVPASPGDREASLPC